MKRFRRWMFNFVAGVSLSLCAISCWVWVRASYTPESWRYLARDPSRYTAGIYRIGWNRGGVYVTHIGYVYNNLRHYEQNWFPAKVLEHQLERNPGSTSTLPWWSGTNEFFSPPERGSGRARVFSFGIHPSLLVGLFAILPVIWGIVFFHHRSQSKRLADCCKTCGYDLRASPERCPECGTAAGTAKEAPT